MTGVLSGFFVIAVIVAFGAVLAHIGIFTVQTQHGLAKVSFYVAMPMLFVTMMSQEDISAVLSGDLVASLAAVFITSMVWLLSVRLVWKLDAPRTVIGMFNTSYINGGNLGLPIAAFALDSPTRVVPVLLAQLLLLQPIGLALLDLTTGGEQKFTWRAFVRRFISNPLTIATLVGVLLSVFAIEIPTLVLTPMEMVGSMAVPAVLMAFGISLRLGPKPDRSGGAMLIWQTFLKLAFMPVVAWVVGRFLLGLEGMDLLAVTVMAALPTAQNVFVIASRYDRGVEMARDQIFVSTIGSIFSILVVTTLLA